MPGAVRLRRPWTLLYDWVGSPSTLSLVGRRWHTLFRYRCVRCRLDGPLAVSRSPPLGLPLYRCLTVAPHVHDLRVDRCGAEGLLSLKLVTPLARLERLHLQYTDTDLAAEDLGFLQDVLIGCPRLSDLSLEVRHVPASQATLRALCQALHGRPHQRPPVTMVPQTIQRLAVAVARRRAVDRRNGPESP